MTKPRPIKPVLIDKRGHAQVLSVFPDKAYDVRPAQAQGFAAGAYLPSELEEDEPQGDGRYRIYFHGDTSRFPKVVRGDNLRREMPAHHGLLDLFDQFDAVAEHSRVDGKVIVLRGATVSAE